MDVVTKSTIYLSLQSQSANYSHRIHAMENKIQLPLTTTRDGVWHTEHMYNRPSILTEILSEGNLYKL